MRACRIRLQLGNSGWPGRPTLTVYSELMKLALESDEPPFLPIPEMVRDALSCRLALDEGEGSAARIGDALTYDVSLARLCERLQLRHDLAGETAGPAARQRAEELIAGRLPSLAAALAGDRSV
jgi:hypothetical protein